MKSVKKNLRNVSIGKHTKINDFTNLYGCQIGDNCMIGTFVEIQEDVIVGDNVKIQSHSFICSGVTIENDVFIGHHVVCCNDTYPTSTNKHGQLKGKHDWERKDIVIKQGASIGSNATLLPGITIGAYAMIGAGAVVTKDVKPNETVVGNPAKPRNKKQIRLI